MIKLLACFAFVFILIISWPLILARKNRQFKSISSVANSYDAWTNDYLLEKLWGEHIHLGYYDDCTLQKDFRKAKVDFVHELVKWSGLDTLPKGSRILDVGCGIGGSSRILANDYGFDVLGITISSEQVKRAQELTSNNTSCRFVLMDALNLDFKDGSFDGVWSVEAGPHMPDKQLYANELLRVLRPGGILAVADWNCRDYLEKPIKGFEKVIMNQLLEQWTHPEFSSIKGFKENLSRSPYSGGYVEVEDWTKYTLPSWYDSILEGLRRPKSVLGLGFNSIFKGLREVPTILMMNWAFSKGLMQFGVFKSRG